MSCKGIVKLQIADLVGFEEVAKNLGYLIKNQQEYAGYKVDKVFEHGNFRFGLRKNEEGKYEAALNETMDQHKLNPLKQAYQKYELELNARRLGMSVVRERDENGKIHVKVYPGN